MTRLSPESCPRHDSANRSMGWPPCSLSLVRSSVHGWRSDCRDQVCLGCPTCLFQLLVVLPCLVLFSLVVFFLVSFCFVVLCLVSSCFVSSCFVLSRLVLFCFVVFCIVLFCLVLFCLVLSRLVFLVLFCLVSSCFVLSCCFVLFCLVLSYFVSSRLVLCCRVFTCIRYCLVLSSALFTSKVGHKTNRPSPCLIPFVVLSISDTQTWVGRHAPEMFSIETNGENFRRMGPTPVSGRPHAQYDYGSRKYNCML